MRVIPAGSRRERLLVGFGGLLVYLALKLLGWTTRKTFVGAAEMSGRFERGEPVILAFWHGRMLMMPFVYRGRGACIMNSGHRDGMLISRAIRPFGIDVVYGSSTRGWLPGLKGLLRAHQHGRDLAVVPDGPKGPRCRAKSGAIQLGRATGAPIFPLSFGASHARVLARAWDGLCIPLPGARVVYVVEEPICVPPDADRAEMETLRHQLELRLSRATWRADLAARVALRDQPGYRAEGPERRETQGQGVERIA